MPYTNKDELPDAVKKLDPKLQGMWLEVFNSAYERYDPDKDKGSREEFAFAQAWSVANKNKTTASVNLAGNITTLEPNSSDLRLLANAGLSPDRREIMKFAGILCLAEENKNHDAVDDQGITDICETLPLMPVDVDHISDKIVGMFTKAYPVDEGKAAYVEAIIYARRFPDEAEKVRSGAYKLSVEAFAQRAKCSLCGEEFLMEAEYCPHLIMRLFGSGATRKLQGLRAFGGALTEDPAGSQTVILPESIMMIASRVTTTFSPDMPLTERYDQFLGAIANDLRLYFDYVPDRIVALLPGSEKAFHLLSGVEAEDKAYAVAQPTKSTIIFSPKHQNDMEHFMGTLSAQSKMEVAAAKGIVHEVLHMAAAKPSDDWDTRSEMVVGESAIELMSTFIVARHLDFEGNYDDLVESVKRTIAFPGNYSWMPNLAVATAGREAPRWLANLLHMSKEEALKQVMQAIDQLGEFGDKKIERFIVTPEDSYDAYQKTVAQVLEAKSFQVTGGIDSLHWFLVMTNDIGKGGNGMTVKQAMKAMAPAYEDLQKKEPAYEDLTKKEPVFEDLQKKEPAYEDLSKKEPAYEDLTKKEPVFEDLAKKEPAYEDLTKKEPVFEDLQKKEPAYEDLTKKEPAYEDLSKKEPAYEDLEKKSPAYEDLQKKEPAYEDLSKKEPAYEDLQMQPGMMNPEDMMMQMPKAQYETMMKKAQVYDDICQRMGMQSVAASSDTEAEAKLATANKAVLVLTREKTALAERVSALEGQIQQFIVASRLNALSEVLDEEELSKHKARLGTMAEEDFKLVLTAATKSRAVEEPKAGSLRGVFVPTGGEAKEPTKRLTTFKGVFSGTDR